MAWALVDVLLFTRSGRAAYLRTCAMMYFESSEVIYGFDNLPADVVKMAFTVNKSSVNQCTGSKLVVSWTEYGVSRPPCCTRIT